MSTLRKEPVKPIAPTENDSCKHELLKAMGNAITAIAKEKGIIITIAEVTRHTNDYFELTIKASVLEEKEVGEFYNEKLKQYNTDFNKWVHERDCIKFGITEEQRIVAEEKYYAHRKENGYVYPEIKKREEFYAEAAIESPQSPIIEVA